MVSTKWCERWQNAWLFFFSKYWMNMRAREKCECNMSVNKQIKDTNESWRKSRRKTTKFVVFFRMKHNGITRQNKRKGSNVSLSFKFRDKNGLLASKWTETLLFHKKRTGGVRWPELSLDVLLLKSVFIFHTCIFMFHVNIHDSNMIPLTSHKSELGDTKYCRCRRVYRLFIYFNLKPICTVAL